jgi:Outer membrane protein beta-barrel domain
MRTKSVKFLSVLVLLTVCILANNSTFAQMRAGVKGGLNVSNLYIDDIDDENARYGFNAGIYGQIFSTDAFAIQPELLYSTKGSRAEYDGLIDQTIKYNLNYLDLPVLAVFKLGESAEIHIGPYASYLLGANISYSGDAANGSDDVDKDNLKSFDYGLAGGFGLNFGTLQVGARYNYGFVKIADSDAAELLLGDSKNSVAQIYLSVNLAKSNK